MVVHVVHDNTQWLEPFLKAFAERGLAVEEVDVSQGGVVHLKSIQSRPDDIWFVRVSPSAHMRGARFSMEAADMILAQLEAAGASVVNGSRALALEMSKVRQELLLQSEGIASPHVVAVVGKSHLADAIRNWKHGVPLLLKHSRGGSGTGVRLQKMGSGVRFFHKTEDALAYVESPDFEEPIDGISLIQRHIVSRDDCVHRLEFVGGKFLYAITVDTRSPANLSQKKQPQAMFTVDPDFTHPVVEQLERVLSRANVDVCAVEIVLDKAGDAFVIDMNCCNTNYNLAAEERAGVRGRGCSAVAAFVEERLQAAGKANRAMDGELAAKRARLNDSAVDLQELREKIMAFGSPNMTTLPDVSRSTCFQVYH